MISEDTVQPLKISKFGGLAPRLGDKLLPDNFATESINAKLFSGELRGWPSLDIADPLHDFADSIDYMFVQKLKSNAGNTTWFGSTTENASIVPDPIVDEAFDRYYLFEPGQPVKVATWNQIDLGQSPDDLALPFPTTAPTVAPTGGAPDGSTPAENRVYVYTWQTSWGEETEPSPTATVLVATDDTVSITAMELPSAIPGRTWDKINIYRSVAGSTSTTFYFVGSVSAVTDAYVDPTESAYIVYNAVIDAFTNEAPPDGLQGARVHPSGAIAAFLGRKVWFSRPFLPHAWPAVYALAVDDDIVGIEIYGESIAVMTETFVYLIYGQSPGQFGLRKFPFASPGLSYRSIVPAEDGVYFCSTEGLIFVNDSGPKNVTADIIDSDEWVTQFYSGDVVAAMYGHVYMAWDRTAGGFMVDFRDQRSYITNWTSTGGVTAINNDWYTGKVMVTIGDKVYQWDDPTPSSLRQYSWKSKVFVTATPANMGALQVNGESGGQATVQVYADGVEKFNQVVDFNRMRRLPSGFKATDWQVRVTSSDVIQEILVGETGRSLANA